MADSNNFHVYPTNDLIEHDTNSEDCICGPTVEAVEREDGSFGWMLTHHSMDGREFREPDYVGPPMPAEFFKDSPDEPENPTPDTSAALGGGE